MGMMRGAHNANSVTGNNWIGSITQGDRGIYSHRWVTGHSKKSTQIVSKIHPCRGGLNIYWGCEMFYSIESEPVTTRSCEAVTTKQDANWIRTFVSQPAWWLWWHWIITMATQSTGRWGHEECPALSGVTVPGWGPCHGWDSSLCDHHQCVITSQQAATPQSSHPAIVQPSKSIIHVNYPKTKLFHPSRPSFLETHSLTSKNDALEY